MRRKFISGPLFFMLISGTTVARCNDLTQIARDLTRELKGKALLLRSYSQGDRLNYNSQGELVQSGSPGTWTLDGHIEIQKVDLKPDRLEIEGSRIFVAFDAGKKRWYGLGGDNLRIQVAIPKGQVTADSMHHLLFKVFLTRAEDAGSLSPLYWKGVIEGKKPNEIGPEELGTLSGDPIEPSGPQYRVSYPVVLSAPSPPYSVEARTHQVSGTVQFAIIVNKQGEVSDILEISAPLGDGLDQNAINTVRKWSFKPALKNRVPVAVLVLLDISFRI